MCLGKMLDKQKNRGALQPYLRNVNVRWFSFDLNDLKEMRFEDGEAARYELQPGDLVICEGGEPGRAAVWRGSAHNARIQKALHRVRFHPDEYNPNFAMYYLYFAAITNRLTPHYTGTTIKHLTGAALAKVRFPIPPLSEQRRIVAKIEELFSDLDAGVVTLERVRANLKRYRAAVLKAAVEGKLTEDWRAQHPSTEPASVLLERILTDRHRQWEMITRLKMKAQGKVAKNEKWKDQYRPPLKPRVEHLKKLPDGWIWTSAGELCECVVPNRDKPKTFTGSIPWITLPDLSETTVLAGSRSGLGLSQQEVTAYKAKVIPKGNVIMSCIGRFGIAVVLGCDAVINQQLHAFLVPEGLLPKYLVYSIVNQEAYMTAISTSTTIAYLNQDNCNSVPVSLPSTDEQGVIVAEVERRLSIVDEIEAQVDADLKRAARLRQGILKRAFEGRLVPQDPTDEPAEKLLERIRRERQSPNVLHDAVRQRRTGSVRKLQPPAQLLLPVIGLADPRGDK
jgi:type I restriction enzyme S subunit